MLNKVLANLKYKKILYILLFDILHNDAFNDILDEIIVLRHKEK